MHFSNLLLFLAQKRAILGQNKGPCSKEFTRTLKKFKNLPGPLKNLPQNTPPWQFSELYHLCNNNLKNDLFASPLVEKECQKHSLTPYKKTL